MTTNVMKAIQKKTTFAVFLTIFIDLIGFGMFIPIIPTIARQFSASDTQATLLATYYSIAMMISVAFFGRLSDKVGRKPVIVSTVLVSTCAQILLGFAGSYGWLVVARLLSGFSAGNLPAAQACLVDITKPEERSKSMVWIGLAFGGGFAFGPMIGSLVLEGVNLFPELVPHQFLILAMVAAALNLTNLIFVASQQPETHPKFAKGEVLELVKSAVESEGNKERTELKSYWKDIKHIFSFKDIRILTLIQFLNTFAFIGIEVLVPLLLVDGYNFPALMVYRTYIFIGIWIIVFNGFVNRPLLNRFKEVKTIYLGQLALAIGMALMAFGAPNPYLLFISVMFTTFSTACINPAIMGLLSQAVSPDLQGSALGMMHSIAGIARISGPAIMGYFYQYGLFQGHLKGIDSLYISVFIIIIGLMISISGLSHISKRLANSKT